MRTAMATVMSLVAFLLIHMVVTAAGWIGGCDNLPRFPNGIEMNIDYRTVILQTEQGPTYRLDAVVNWPEINYTHDGVSGYAGQMVRLDGSYNPIYLPKCHYNLTDYQYTASSEFVFENLTYGFQYLFKIRTANITTRMTDDESYGQSSYTPDCYEATKDEDFCINQPVQLASAPRDLQIDCSDSDQKNNFSRVSLSWLAPLQVNGTLTKFIIGHMTDERLLSIVIHPDIKVDQGTRNLSSYRFNATILDLKGGHNYTINVYPFVENAESGVRGHYSSSVVLHNASSDRPCEPEGPSGLAPTEDTSAPDITRVSMEPALVAGLVCATAIIAVIIGFVILSRRRLSSQKKAIFTRYPDEISTTYSCSVKKDTYHIGSPELNFEVDPVLHKMEFDRSLLKMEDILGSGQFGCVYKGFAYGIDGKEIYTPVAVKSLRENATRSMKEDFLAEIKLIVEIGSHPNILPILGCCTVQEPHYLIAELMKYGDLLHFLWKCREAKNALDDPIYKLTATGQLQIAIQISRGMEYLSTTLYYHGDLAARNVLVGEGLICKISDFGLADDIYQRGYKRLAPERKRPVKWVSLETNTQGKCSIESDVWSFGIVLYEIYTLGGVPYPGMDGRQVIAKLQQGYRMERPSMCPEEIWHLTRSCWCECAHNRPTFTILHNALDAMLTENVDYLTELETDYTVYEFVPCMETDTFDESEMTGEGDNGLLPTISQDLHVRQNGRNSKFEEKQYAVRHQISQDSAFSEDSVLSGEFDELDLWRHITAARSQSPRSRAVLARQTRCPSIEFVPIFEYDSDSLCIEDEASEKPCQS